MFGRGLRILFAVSTAVFSLNSANADDWPAAGTDTLRTICYQKPRTDVPRDYLDAYCICYVGLVKSNVPWNDWLLLDLAVRIKGIQNLDAQEKHIAILVLEDATYCFWKYIPQQ
jgi:hypothetical protein